MSITIIAQPQLLTPAYNPHYWYFDSTNKTEKAFRYRVNVLEQGTNRLIGEYKLRPIPTTLYGEVDLSKLISSEFTMDFQDATIYAAADHYKKYYLKVDEEYIVEESFAGYAFMGAAIWTNFSDPAINPNGISRTALAFSLAGGEPMFEAGDVINVVQNTLIRPELEGVHTVLDKFSDASFWYVVLDLPWISRGDNSAGKAAYADGQKTIVTGITTGVKEIFKGAFPFKLFKDYDHVDYIANGVTKNFLSLMPDGVRISRKVNSFITAYSTGTTRLVYEVDGELYRTASNGVSGLKRYKVLPTDVVEKFVDGAWAAFADEVSLEDVNTYRVRLASNTVYLTDWRVINLYDECDFFDTFDVTFLDRLSNWITIPFYKGHYVSQDVMRETFRKKYGKEVSGAWAYDLKDTGTEVYTAEEDLTFTINTGQLNVDECSYFRELMTTAQAYVTINDDELRAIEVTNNNYDILNKRTSRERKLSLNFKFSVNDKTNV